MTTILESEAQVALDVKLHWSIAEIPETNVNTSYTVTVIPESLDQESISITTNTSRQLTLLTDQDYNISVAARNCVGTSKQAEIYITRDGL